MKKISFIIVGILLLLVIGFMMLSSYCRNLNATEQTYAEEKIGAQDKQALILYQESITNMVKDNVDAISATLQKSGYSIVTNHPRADLDYAVQDYDVIDFDVIVLVSPTYARQVAQPLLDFIDTQDFTSTKVYGVIVGMIEQKGQAKRLEERIKNADKKEVVKVAGFDNSYMLETLEGFLSE